MRNTLTRPAAVARVRGETPEGPAGTVSFYPARAGALVVADIAGLPGGGDCASGVFGFHIHEGASCGGDDFSETKGHWNSTPCGHPYHTGDLPPLFSCGGRAYLAVLTGRFRVSDVIGRTVVIHSQSDDFTTQPSGNAGTKLACGEIVAV